MASRTIVELTDDLDGSPAQETITFSLDGTTYEVDLNAKNAKKLRDSLNKFVGAARRAGGGSTGPGRGRGRRGSASARSSSATDERTYDPREVRAWAEKQGIEVSPRGRVPGGLVVQFTEAMTR